MKHEINQTGIIIMMMMMIIIIIIMREISYLFQRLSVIAQRFNSVLIHESFVSEVHTD